MKKLCYQTLKDRNYDGYLLPDAPERVLQFGEGNFLRAFVDYFIDVLNEKAGFNSKVVLCQPIAQGLTDMINEQEGLYTLYLRGFQGGQKVNQKRIISCVSRCLNPYTEFDALLACADNPDLRYITCNTTEAGIVYDPSCQFADTPADSYPGKLTQFLYRRFQTWKNASCSMQSNGIWETRSQHGSAAKTVSVPLWWTGLLQDIPGRKLIRSMKKTASSTS